ncbi:hypothetical protein FT663_01942 [Candidozyma haemuli var. vulneris]|nr:hypothetical protein FT663_01942 [[Candida] haemuloni var. vulneris]
MTDGFIGKIKQTFSSKEKQNEKILRASYRAGKRKAQSEAGVKRNNSTSSSSSSSSDEGHPAGKNTTGTAAPGQTFGSKSDPAAAGAAGAALGGAGGAAAGTAAGGSSSSSQDPNVIRSTNKGRVVSQPPNVSREPLEKQWGGDYANEKKPTEVSGGTGPESSNAIVDNTNPGYDNAASPVQGHGRFYDPKDTQGGLYGSNANESNAATYAGAGAAGAGAGALGASAVKGGDSDDSKYTEATKQQAPHNKNLKTKPDAYAEQDKIDDEANRVSEQAYAKGQRQAHEIHQQGQEKAKADADEGKIGSQVDEDEEHSKNRSAYNRGGVKSAYREVSGQDGPSDKSSAGNAAAGAAAGGAAGAGASHLANKGDAHSNVVKAGEPPSSEDFDYDSEIKRLDKNIETTQKEIDAIHSPNRSTLDPKASGNAGSSAIPTGQSKSAVTGSNAGTSSGSGRALAGAGTGAALGSGAGYAAGSGSSEQKHSQPETTSRSQQQQSSSGTDYKDYYDAGVRKGAYEAGRGQGVEEKAYSAGQDAASKDAKDAASSSSSGTGSGIVAGAAGAFGAASVLASQALGFGGSNKTTESHEADVGPAGATNAASAVPGAGGASHGASVHTQGAPEARGTSQEGPAGQHGYLDSAKGALGSAGASAAGALGYNEYENKSKDNEQQTKQSTSQPSASAKYGSTATAPSAVETGGAQSLKHPGFQHPRTEGPGLTAASGSEDRRGADDVAKEAKEKAQQRTKSNQVGNASESGSGPTNADTKSASSGQSLETDVSEHNKKQGIKNDGRSLLDIAEQEDPSIAKLKHATGLHGADELDNGEEQATSKADDIQPIPDVALHSKSEFINSGGKSGQLGGAAKITEDIERNQKKSSSNALGRALGAGAGSPSVFVDTPPAPSSGQYQDSPYYAPERGGNHPAPRVSGQAYVSKDQREQHRREVLASENAGANAGPTAGADTAADSGYSSKELEEKTLIETAYAAGVKKLAEERGLGPDHPAHQQNAHSDATSSKKDHSSEPVVEVIGISDREKAQKVALKATRDLSKQGEDVSNSKIVVDANKREIYIEKDASEAQRTKDAERAQREAEAAKSSDSTGAAAAAGAAGSNKEPHPADFHGQVKQAGLVNEQNKSTAPATGAPTGTSFGTGSGSGSGSGSGPGVGAAAGTAGLVGAAGAAGAYAGSKGSKSSNEKPDASFSQENPRDVDPRNYHNQHEKVKDELEEFAEEGRLGNIEPQGSAFSGSAPAIGAAGAGAAGAAGAAGLAGSSKQPDASFDEPNPREVDPRKYHQKHEQVRDDLEEYAEEGQLGNVEPKSSAPGAGAAAAGLGAAGLAGGAAAGSAQSKHPDASFHDPSPGDVDPKKYHNQHEEVKDELEEFAEEGQLGNVEPQPAGSAGAAGLGAAGLGAGAAGASTGSQQPDATFHQSNPGDVDPKRYHNEHEKAKDELEGFAQEGNLGNVSGAAAGTGGHSGYREPYPSTSTEGGSDPNFYQNVKVIGVKDTETAKDLAKQAVAAVQGRTDLLNGIKELRVDSSGAVTDENGQFLIQLGHPRGSLSEGKDTQPRGGGVTPPVTSGGQNVPSAAAAALAGSAAGYGTTTHKESPLKTQSSTIPQSSGTGTTSGTSQLGTLGGNQSYSPRDPLDTQERHSNVNPSGTSGQDAANLSDRLGNLRTDDLNATSRGLAGQGASTTAAPGVGASSGSATAAPEKQGSVAMPGSFDV